MIAIDVRDAVKRFGAVTALAGVSLTIRDNEFFTLLGPSGCGKTTLLRLIAGFEEITEGEILLYGEDIGTLPPEPAPHQHRLSALRPLPAHDGGGKCGVRHAEARLEQGRHREAQTGRILDLVKLGDLAGAQAGAALRRSAAAGGAGASDGATAQSAPARRTAVGARPQAAPSDADRAEADPEGHRHHLRLRHPRPGRSAHDVGPHRRDVGGRDPAGGHAPRNLRGAH